MGELTVEFLKTTLQLTNDSTAWGLVEIHDKQTHEILNRYRVSAVDVEKIHRGEMLPPNFTLEDHKTKYYSASSRVCEIGQCYKDPVTGLLTINAGIVEDSSDLDVILIRVSNGYWRKVGDVIELESRLVAEFGSALNRITVANP